MGALKMIRRWRADDEGSELIEFALVTPVLLLMLVGIFDFALLFQRYQVVTNAAREGARIGILPGYGTADVQARVGDYLRAGGLGKSPVIDVSVVPVKSGTTKTFNAIRVVVEYPHQFTLVGPIASWFGGSFGTVQLRAATVMKMEI